MKNMIRVFALMCVALTLSSCIVMYWTRYFKEQDERAIIGEYDVEVDVAAYRGSWQVAPSTDHDYTITIALEDRYDLAREYAEAPKATIHSVRLLSLEGAELVALSDPQEMTLHDATAEKKGERSLTYTYEDKHTIPRQAKKIVAEVDIELFDGEYTRRVTNFVPLKKYQSGYPFVRIKDKEDVAR